MKLGSSGGVWYKLEEREECHQNALNEKLFKKTQNVLNEYVTKGKEGKETWQMSEKMMVGRGRRRSEWMVVKVP